MIRQMKTADRATYIALSKEFYNSDAVLHKIPKENFIKTFDLIINGSSYADGFMFEVDSKAAGYAILSFSYSNEVGGIVLWLEEIYIGPDFRGHGIGGEFFEYIENKYKENIAAIRLEVTDSNERAINMYKKKDYKILNYIQMIKGLGNA